MTRARFFLVPLLLVVCVETAMTLASDNCRQCQPEAFQERRNRMLRDQIDYDEFRRRGQSQRRAPFPAKAGAEA